MQYCWSVRNPEERIDPEVVRGWLDAVDRARGERHYFDPEFLDNTYLNGSTAYRPVNVPESRDLLIFNEKENPNGGPPIYDEIIGLNMAELVKRAQKEGLIKDYAEAS